MSISIKHFTESSQLIRTLDLDLDGDLSLAETTHLHTPKKRKTFDDPSSNQEIAPARVSSKQQFLNIYDDYKGIEKHNTVSATNISKFTLHINKCAR